ncbi:unnamed protein product [Linum tenue]|uniref:Endonuclease/exonuclease/phosphatase domain-containing protein n=1 Tax=Linum tenue TaxID=586396 RepID=A0AAV0ID25_9ROSI|nr:unnamed protein product [Linum tenue]
MFRVLNRSLRLLCSRLRCRRRRHHPSPTTSTSKIQIKKFGKSNSKSKNEPRPESAAAVHPNNHLGSEGKPKIKVATFNAALFSMAPAVPEPENSPGFEFGSGFGRSKSSVDGFGKTASVNDDRPIMIKSILKQSPLHTNSTSSSSRQQKFARSKLRVSINLPDNEISKQLSFREGEDHGGAAAARAGKAPAAASRSQSLVMSESERRRRHDGSARRSVVEVLRELDADILALQEVKAEEEKGMKPLSDLAAALGMNYVFADSWAPEYGNAILSKWPIKRWKVHKIFDDSDFRNVLKATINVPNVGEVNFHCTHLDHLDEQWRMKQVNAIIDSSEGPHLLAGGLNSLDETDYNEDRWIDIVKYYEEMGKPTPKAEVMRFLKKENYTDAKDYAGECESVVMIAKGQNVQGTCKYGTRVDYIVASPNSPYKFVPGSYSVLSSKGTSDHHIVKVDVVKEHDGGGGGGGDNKSGGSRGYSGQQSVGRKNRGNRAQQTSLVK